MRIATVYLIPEPWMRSRIVLLAAGLCAGALAQHPATAAPARPEPPEKEQVRKPLPLTDQELEVVRNLNSLSEKVQVQKPLPFTDQELKVIRNINSLSTDRLVELMKVYDKLDNAAMTQILVRQVLKRSPNNAEALRISESLDAPEEVRSVGYLDALAAQLLDGKKVEDTDGIAAQAGALLLQERASEAVRLLEALQELNFKGQPFPYMEDLASAYQDSGMYDRAEVAYQAVISDPTSSPEAKQEAQDALPEIAMQKRIAGLREQAMQNPDAGLELSSKLLAEKPGDRLAVAFRVECLDRAGRYDEVVGFLEKLKRESKGPTFEYQETLAYAYYGAKNWGKAREAFDEITNNAAYDEEARTGAEKMLVVVHRDEQLEKGAAALKTSDVATAKVLLSELEHEFPDDHDVFGFRCIVMAKTGHSKEALEELLRRRMDAARRHELFTELDALADVYLERKEYILAISAYDDIINNPAYDAEMRAEAVKGLEEAKREQKLYKAYLALDDGDPALAKRYSDDLLISSPLDPEVQVLGADIDLAYGHAEEALEEYRAIKARHYRDLPFPGESGVAEALFRLGNWEDALQAYDEIIQRPGYELDDVWSARWDRRSLLPYLRNQLTLDSHFQDESEGTIFSQSLSYTTTWWHDWRLTVSAREDFIRLDDRQRFTSASDVSRFEAQLAIQRRFNGGYFAEVTIGGAEDNVLYGARLGKFTSTGVGWGSIGWSLGFSGNAAAEYSLPLRAINGRENRIEFNAEGYLHPRVRFDLDAYAAWVHVDGDKLGHGYGASGKLEYIFSTETRTRPEIALGYFGEYTRFHAESKLPSAVTRSLRAEELQVRQALAADQDLKKALPSNHGREIFDALVEPETNRHGVMISLRKRIDLDWNVYAEAGTYRDFIDQSWEYTVAAGVEYWMTDSAMIYVEVRYDSNGASSDQGVWEASLGAEVTF